MEHEAGTALKARIHEIHNTWTKGLGEEENPITIDIALNLMWEAIDDLAIHERNWMRVRLVSETKKDAILFEVLESLPVTTLYKIAARVVGHKDVYYLTFAVGAPCNVKTVLETLQMLDFVELSDYRFFL
jgi:hypothetical protein